MVSITTHGAFDVIEIDVCIKTVYKYPPFYAQTAHIDGDTMLLIYFVYIIVSANMDDQ